MLNHWIFTWHYFEAACLFKLSFSSRSYVTLEKLDRRKKILQVVNVSALVLMFLSQAFLLYCAADKKIEKEGFDRLEYGAATLGMLALAIILLLAMRYI